MKSKNVYLFLVLFVLQTLLIGCTTVNTINPLLHWNDKNYFITFETIDKDKLTEIDEVTSQQKKKKLQNNGDAYRLEKGAKIYEIKDMDSSEIIAVDFDNDYYIGRVILENK